MATQLGNIAYTLGQQYNIYCSDRSIQQLKNYSYNLPSNSIIVSSPINSIGNDVEIPAILMTDYRGNVLPLTYSFNKTQFAFNETNNQVAVNMTYIQNYMYSYFSNIFVRK